MKTLAITFKPLLGAICVLIAISCSTKNELSKEIDTYKELNFQWTLDGQRTQLDTTFKSNNSSLVTLQSENNLCLYNVRVIMKIDKNEIFNKLYKNEGSKPVSDNLMIPINSIIQIQVELTPSSKLILCASAGEAKFTLRRSY